MCTRPSLLACCSFIALQGDYDQSNYKCFFIIKQAYTAVASFIVDWYNKKQKTLMHSLSDHMHVLLVVMIIHLPFICIYIYLF